MASPAIVRLTLARSRFDVPANDGRSVRRLDASLHLRALHIGPDGQWAGVGLSELGDGRIEIEQADVTDDELPDTRLLRDTAHDRGRRMQRTACTCRDGEMHDQDVRSFCEFGEFRIGSVLIGAEDDRYIPGLHAVCQGRHIAVRDAQRRHRRAVPAEHRRRFGFRGIDHADIETNTAGHSSSDIAPNATRLRSTQRRTEHRKCTGFVVEEPTEEGGKIRRGVVAGGTGDDQWFLAKLVALPQESRQVGNVVGMKVADADHPQIFKLRLRLTEPMVSPTTHIDKYSRPTIDPEKVARRNANWIDSGTAGAEDLHGHRTSAAALCGGARPIHRDREKSEQANDRESNHENLRPFEWLTVIGQRLMRAMCQSADIVDRLVGRLVA